jgi:hypothetical protein
VVQKWKRILILLCVEAISLFTTFDKKNSLMVKCMLDFCGLGVEELARKLVNKFSVFQGHQTNVTMQFKDKVVSFIIGVHCFAH